MLNAVHFKIELNLGEAFPYLNVSGLCTERWNRLAQFHLVLGAEGAQQEVKQRPYVLCMFSRRKLLVTNKV